MLSHFTLGTNDLERAKNFYSELMATLDQKLIRVNEEFGLLKFGPAEDVFPHLFLVRPLDDLPATWSNGFHIAFNAKSSAAVDRFYEVAMANGGIDEGEPGLRPHYAKDYYATYVRDPDGNKLQAVCYLDGRSTAPTGEWISHITIGHTDMAREKKFYSAVFQPLGITLIEEESDFESMGYGIEGSQLPVVYVQPSFDGRPATWGNGTHTAFSAATRDAVDLFYQAAIDHGGVCDGPPGLRAHYSKNYYGAYVRDPVGNKLQAVCRAAA